MPILMQNTKQRIIYGYPLGAIALAILVYGDKLLYITISIISLILMKEFFELTRIRTERRFVTMRRWGYFLGLLILLLVYLKQTQYLEFVIVAIFIALMLHRIAIFSKQKGDFLHELSISVFGALYIGLCMSYFFKLKELGMDLINFEIIPSAFKIGKYAILSQGANFLVALPIVGSWGYDFSAFFSGSLLGRTKLAPLISPKKTVEGMIGGLIGCVVACLLIAFAIGIKAKYYLFLTFLGLVMGTMCQLGDLYISTIKREAGAKDSAAVIPGHGGLLDKCDGMLFVLPTSYYLVLFAFNSFVLNHS